MGANSKIKNAGRVWLSLPCAALLAWSGPAAAQQDLQQQALERQRQMQQQQLTRIRNAQLGRRQVQMPDDVTMMVQNSGRTLAELVAALDAPSLVLRQEAHVELSQRSDFKLADLEAALDSPDLSPEQRIRLDAAARDKFVDGPRGAMGITWNQELPSSRPSIIETARGFDAHGKLEPGDVFVSAGHQQIRGHNARELLRWEIISRDPGDVLPVTVRRGAEILSFDLTLGSFEDLNQGRAFLQDIDLASAYRVRQERRGRNAVGDSLGLNAGDWVVARVEGEDRLNKQIQRRRSRDGNPVLVAGGVPRQGLDDDRDEKRLVNARGKMAVIRAAGGARLILDDPMARPVTVRQMSIQEEIAAVEKRIATLREMVARPIDESQRPGTGVEEGANADAIRVSAQERLNAAEKVLEALKAEAAEAGELVEHTDNK